MELFPERTKAKEDESMKTMEITYTGIRGTATEVVEFDPMDWYEDLGAIGHGIFAKGMTDEEARAYCLEIEGLSEEDTKAVLGVVRCLRKVGGLWIMSEDALIEGRGLVNARKDPELRPLWEAARADIEIYQD